MAEHLTFNQGVRSSTLRWSTRKNRQSYDWRFFQWNTPPACEILPRNGFIARQCEIAARWNICCANMKCSLREREWIRWKKPNANALGFFSCDGLVLVLFRTQNKTDTSFDVSVLVRWKGLEPLTYWFVASHSIQLSYQRITVLNSLVIITSTQRNVNPFFKFF